MLVNKSVKLNAVLAVLSVDSFFVLIDLHLIILCSVIRLKSECRWFLLCRE